MGGVEGSCISGSPAVPVRLDPLRLTSAAAQSLLSQLAVDTHQRLAFGGEGIRPNEPGDEIVEKMADQGNSQGSTLVAAHQCQRTDQERFEDPDRTRQGRDGISERHHAQPKQHPDQVRVRKECQQGKIKLADGNRPVRVPSRAGRAGTTSHRSGWQAR